MRRFPCPFPSSSYDLLLIVLCAQSLLTLAVVLSGDSVPVRGPRLRRDAPLLCSPSKHAYSLLFPSPPHNMLILRFIISTTYTPRTSDGTSSILGVVTHVEGIPALQSPHHTGADIDYPYASLSLVTSRLDIRLIMCSELTSRQGAYKCTGRRYTYVSDVRRTEWGGQTDCSRRNPQRQFH